MLKEIKLYDFRNHHRLTISFGMGLNLLYGDNGSGKTSVLEGIYLALKAKSFRTGNSADMIREGADLAVVSAEVEDGRATRTLARQISRRGTVKTKIDGKECNAAAPINLLQAVVFTQEEIQVIKGEPQRRREWIDSLAEEIFADAADILRDYRRALHQRNETLKAIRAGKEREDSLSPWDEIIAERGARIRMMRSEALKELEARVRRMLEKESEVFSVRYYGTFEDMDDLLQKLKRGRSRDIVRGTTSTGPHRDEMVFSLNERNLRNKGSQGQQRKVSLLLTLAASEILEDKKEQRCLLMLDDMLSELDENVTRWILDRVEGKGQALVTANANRIGDFRGREVMMHRI